MYEPFRYNIRKLVRQRKGDAVHILYSPCEDTREFKGLARPE